MESGSNNNEITLAEGSADATLSDAPEGLRDLPDAMRELARSIDNTPSNFSREFAVVQQAYAGGCVSGVGMTIGAYAIMKLIGNWWRRGQEEE